MPGLGPHGESLVAAGWLSAWYPHTAKYSCKVGSSLPRQAWCTARCQNLSPEAAPRSLSDGRELRKTEWSRSLCNSRPTSKGQTVSAWAELGSRAGGVPRRPIGLRSQYLRTGWRELYCPRNARGGAGHTVQVLDPGLQTPTRRASGRT